MPGQDGQEAEPPEPAPRPEPGVVPPAFAGTARAAEGGRAFSRYAGAMLLHAYPGRAGEILPQAAGGDVREAALLSAVSTCFALGAATAEQVKHLAPAEAGPLAGLAALPSLRTLRPRLAAIADATDPLELQAAFAAAMLAANPETSGVYYVDDHFVPYAGAKPVGKGWNNKRGRAEKGRADTHVTTHDGRAVCFVTGEPSGLSVTLPKALAELKKTIPPGGADHARVRPRRRLPGCVRALPRQRRALGDLPARPAGRPADAAGPVRDHRERQGPARSPGPTRKSSSRTTARPGRSPCSSTAGPSCRC